MGIGRHNIVGGWKKLHGRMPGPRGPVQGPGGQQGRWSQEPVRALGARTAGWLHRQHTPRRQGPNHQRNRPAPSAPRIASQLDSADCEPLFRNPSISRDGMGMFSILRLKAQPFSFATVWSISSSLPLRLPRDGRKLHRWHDPWSVTALFASLFAVASLLITVPLAVWPVRLCLGRIAWVTRKRGQLPRLLARDAFGLPTFSPWLLDHHTTTPPHLVHPSHPYRQPVLNCGAPTQLASASLPGEGGNCASARSRAAEAIRDVLSACLSSSLAEHPTQSRLCCLSACRRLPPVDFSSVSVSGPSLLPCSVCLHLPYEGNLRRLFPPPFPKESTRTALQESQSRSCLGCSPPH